MWDINFYLSERGSHSGGGISAQQEILILFQFHLNFPTSPSVTHRDDEECEIINSKYLVYWPKYSQDSYNQKVSFPKMSLYGNPSCFVKL